MEAEKNELYKRIWSQKERMNSNIIIKILRKATKSKEKKNWKRKITEKRL